MSETTSDESIPSPPDALTHRQEGEVVRFMGDDIDGWRAGCVDEVRTGGDNQRHAAVTIGGRGYSSAVFDLESHFDARVGWTTIQIIRRDYGRRSTHFNELGPLDTIESVSLGIDPDALRPGDTVTHVDGTRYRVVLTPTEREYDSKVLAYSLDGGANTNQKVDPSELLTSSQTRTEDVADSPVED